MAELLVGRTAELAALADAVGAVGEGEGRAILLRGESGTGKTTLVQHAVAEGRQRGFRIVDVRARRDETPLSALRAALSAKATAGRDELRSLLARLADDTPVLLAVDDLHAADGATRAAVPYLIRHLRRRPVLVVASYNGDRLGDQLGDQLTRLVDAGRVEELSLGRFSADDLVALVSARAGSTPHPRFVDVLLERSSGLPFHAVELLDVLLAAGAEPSSSLAVGRLSDLILPRRVSTAILHRVFELGGDARSVASAASVLDRAPLDRISYLVELTELPSIRVNNAFDRLVRARVLLVDGEEFCFRHALVREALYADLAPPVRRSWHSKAAMRLAHERSAARPSDAVEVAAHLRRAGGGRDADAARLLRAAGDTTIHDDPTAAASWYEDALSRLDPASPEVQELQISLGQALDLAGRHDEAARVTASALRRLEPGPERERAASVASNAAFAAGRFELAGLFLDAAMEQGELPPALLLQRGWIRFWQGRLAAAADDLISARALGVGGAAPLAEALEMHLGFNRGDAHRAAALAERLRFRVGQLAGPVRTCVEIAVRIADAFDLDPGRAVVDPVTAPGSVSHHAFSAYALWRLGRLDDAKVSARVAADALGSDGVDLAASVVHAVQIATLAEQGDLVGAEAAHQEARSTQGLVLPFLVDCAAARLLVIRDESALAMAVLRETVRRESEIGRTNVLAMSLATMVETAVAAGDHVAARSANERLQRLPCDGASVAMTMWRQRSHAIAERDERAARSAREHAVRHHLALEAARMLLLVGDVTGDVATVSEAADELEALGAVSLHQEATVMLRRLGGRSPHRTSRARTLTGDERRIVTLVAEGLTNRQIAKRMHLSPKTIEVYLSRIYARTGRRSRVELAVAVQRNDLEGMNDEVAP